MSTVPIFGGDGQVHDVPYEQMKDALAHGGKPAVMVKFKNDPSGQARAVPAEKTAEAVQNGGQIVPFEEQQAQHPGFWHAVAQDAIGAAKGVASAGLTAMQVPAQLQEAVGLNPPNIIAQAKSAPAEWQARKAAGYSLPYRALAPVAEMAGVNVPAMEQSAREGDVGGVGGRTVVPTAAALVPSVASRVVPPVLRGAQSVLDSPVAEAATAAAKASAAKLPAAAVRRIPYLGDVISDTYKAGAEAYAKAKLPPDLTAENVPFAGEKAPPPSGSPDATAENKPYAGEPPPPAAPKPPAKLLKQAKALAPSSDAIALQQSKVLQQSTADLVDKAIPPDGQTKGLNLKTQSKVDFYLQKGNVNAAEKALQDAMDSLPEDRRKDFTGWYKGPERRMGQTVAPEDQGFNFSPPEDLGNKVRAETEAKMGPIKRGNKADAPMNFPPPPFKSGLISGEVYGPMTRAAARAKFMDEAATQQEMAADLEKHGMLSEMDARKAFIERNKIDLPKSELIRRAKIATQPEGTSVPQTSEDMTKALQKSLDEIKKKKGNQPEK